MTQMTMTHTDPTFWDRIAPKYAAHKIADEAAYAYTLDRTLAYLSADDRVLELGACTGTTALRLAPGVAEIVATDLSPGMIAIAEGRKAEAGTQNVRFQAASVTEALRLDGPFDAVLGFNLFHLLPDMERVFVEIADLLPPGGHFISKTPCLADPGQGLLRFVLPVLIPVLKRLGKAPFVRRFDQATLEQALERAGFEIVEAGNFPARSRYVVARKR